MKRLEPAEIANALQNLPDWSLEDDKWLRKRFRFPAFLSGIAFVNDIARLSEDVNHHPLIAIDYKVVTLKLTSWHMKGVTDLDIELIQKYDQIYNEMMNKDQS
ncbi:4a-hydroxytetrahydrobiopterin dehydratase [Camelliibacillus cellulosilyticus]|uniref:4a-hydroxytetrahydrobiopterin dehydratase n=1 Tax=Camelliibacillus cellulosilyticus TaxID=2174486 RepID=A0ABV9GRN7_9BACL